MAGNADRTGQRLGNYQLIRLLAQGGFAEVYLGQHIYLNNQAAIKVLLMPLSGDAPERFINEARTLVNLIHPNIVRVLEFGVEQTIPFLVMDYAPNGSLRQCYPRGVQLPLSSVAAYVKQAASALQYAHDQKLIHRDIKPENMLMGRNHELLVSDFGIAVFAHSSFSESAQRLVGTLAYMAPEQAQGKPRPASDQYSLAIVAYEWLCGERPFHGSLTELATQQLFTDPPPLREKAPEVSPAIEQVIKTALAKDPKQRYGSIQEFAHALEFASQFSQLPARQNPDPNSHILSHALVVNSNASVEAVSHSSPTSKEQAKIMSPSGESGGTSLTAQPVGRRRVYYVLLGILLYTISSNFVILVHLSSAQSSQLLWLLPTLVIPIISGLVYGFWAGFITGGLGYFLGNYVTIALRWNAASNSQVSFLTLSSIPLPWYFSMAFLSIGSIAGLAAIFTKGRYQSLKNILIAEAFSMLGILCAFFIALNGFWPRLYPYESMWLDFTHIALPNMLLVLVLVSLLLTTYRLINKGIKPTPFVLS